MDQEKINELTRLEESAHQFLSQRQSFQTQVLEIDSALKELEGDGPAYRIIGSIMVSADKDSLKKELSSKRDMLKIRIGAIEKQESRIKEKSSKLQKEVMQSMKE